MDVRFSIRTTVKPDRLTITKLKKLCTKYNRSDFLKKFKTIEYPSHSSYELHGFDDEGIVYCLSLCAEGTPYEVIFCVAYDYEQQFYTKEYIVTYYDIICDDKYKDFYAKIAVEMISAKPLSHVLMDRWDSFNNKERKFIKNELLPALITDSVKPTITSLFLNAFSYNKFYSQGSLSALHLLIYMKTNDLIIDLSNRTRMFIKEFNLITDIIISSAKYANASLLSCIVYALDLLINKNIIINEQSKAIMNLLHTLTKLVSLNETYYEYNVELVKEIKTLAKDLLNHFLAKSYFKEKLLLEQIH